MLQELCKPFFFFIKAEINIQGCQIRKKKYIYILKHAVASFSPLQCLED